MSLRMSLEGQCFDVVVIGAGIAGSMAALLCSRAGLRTILLERHRFPRDKVCGCCINGRALQILTRAGLASGLQNLQPTTTSILAIRYGGQKLDVPMPESFAVSRRAMDQWLVQEAVNAGCTFVDEATASVQLLPSDHWLNDSVDSRSADGSDEREIQLQFAGRISCRPAGDGSASPPTNARVFAKVVLVCDGLGHPSLHNISSFNADTKPGSRIGLGAVFPRGGADDWIKRGEVLMAVNSKGYVGIVEIEDNQLNLAAAIYPASLKKAYTPLDVLADIFQSVGIPMPQQLSHASIKGTVPLTRTARRIVGHRLFLLGDSTGYVEPFTGEGMAWAFTAAAAVIPLVESAIRDGWSVRFADRWQTSFNAMIGSQQKICRSMAATLRHPWLLPPVLIACQLFPSLTQQIVSRINRIPKALETP